MLESHCFSILQHHSDNHLDHAAKTISKHVLPKVKRIKSSVWIEFGAGKDSRHSVRRAQGQQGGEATSQVNRLLQK